MDKRKKALSCIIGRIVKGETGLEGLKREASTKFGLGEFVKNTEIMAAFPKSRMTGKILKLLKRKPMRTLSGVAPIAVMVRPAGSCRWGCIYCPYTGKAPKSYTGSEPAALRAIQSGFNPFTQARTRIRQFEINCHPTEKCDLIIMGGTFLSMPAGYKTNFVKGLYDALNPRKSRTLAGAKKLNEKARHRMVGLTIETRPDVCGKTEADEMLGYGATKVELGVQNPSDEIYERINRGHSVSDVVAATRLLKDSAFKVAYHLMPGLPGSNPEKDIGMLKGVFSNPDFRPDMLKIYPTLAIPGTPLHEMMLAGGYEPYSTEIAAEVIARAYKYIPGYARVMRIQRDIPSNLIAGGVKKSNLRELVEKKAEALGIRINEIRYREAGLNFEKISEPSLSRMQYEASGGEELFLSIEDKKSGALAAFLRLRIPGKSIRPEITDKTSLVRELHVCGEETPLGEKGAIQHRGFGTLLLSEAEKISEEEFDRKKMTVISAAGVRPYYSKKGYSPDGPYVSKKL